MKYLIDTVLAGARAERLDSKDVARDGLRQLLEKQAEQVEASVSGRNRLIATLRNIAAQVAEGDGPYASVITSSDGYSIGKRISESLQGVDDKGAHRRLARDIVEARAHLAHLEKDEPSPLESYLQAAREAGETHISQNALKEAGVNPRAVMDYVAKGHQARQGKG